jgi:hypothetical protein
MVAQRTGFTKKLKMAGMQNIVTTGDKNTHHGT